jgi:hypothetical protein
MSRRAVDRENPDRLYTVTGGRSQVDNDAFDLVALVVAETDPSPGMQSEHAKILRMCRRPTALVEVSSELGLPVSVVKILVRDLLEAGSISVREPPSAGAGPEIPDPEILKQVLVGLQRL